MSRYRIFKAYYEWHVYEYGQERYESFPTWAESMEYADQQARTIKVTLPRLTALPTGRHTVPRNGLIIEHERSSSLPHLPTGYIVVEPWELRPLALALLAIAQHKEEE
ncbi:hypothetical protein QP363_10820 [Corynebacterium sp. UMB6689]|uniref:hypothetical protein n=1 Tax=Corynebacterium sp. UMB6689 TaxID=3046341 RepID=UPI00254C03E3|nr:hypothetical protein [Corynebacterium sp. UMB6689]MDK6814480.1 hypothetical protein [Corynebacterium sp. UMB6689]